MATPVQFYDAVRRLAQVGASTGVRLVRLLQVDENNRYTARPIEFDQNGQTIFASQDTTTVVNLAEPADATGQIPPNTDAVALDVEAEWVIFVRPTSAALFSAKVTASQGGAAYTVREQVPTGAGTFADKQGAENLTTYNLAELSLGPGAAVDNNAIVLVTTLVQDGNPPVLRYVFDHPTYTKYLS